MKHRGPYRRHHRAQAISDPLTRAKKREYLRRVKRARERVDRADFHPGTWEPA